MAEAKVFVNRPPSASSPINCAICLGSCANKCFSDSCMHEFCFKCLLQWSKIKAECPLCKQPFKRIIHNVKSNEDYEEHVVETQRSDDLINLLDNTMPDEFFIMPPTLHQLPTTHPHRHEFHVRTTFTVDSSGEQAVQHMLLTHPLMAGGRITFGANYHHQGAPGSSRTVFPTRHRPRDFSATSFRRSIYAQNLWVNALPDFTGRYRDVTPQFFRNNPAARTRLVPWLNRELNALLYENTQLIMHLVDRILETLLDHHICSRFFRNLLEEYLAAKTSHFVHEFYSFMRSPFDMVGYDRNVIYTTRPQSPAPFLEDETVEVATSDDDSDVIIVGSSNPSQPVTINLVETDSDEPELVTSNVVQLPMPILPPPQRADSPLAARPFSSPPVLPIQLPIVNLPPKLRHKNNKHAAPVNEKNKDKRKRHRYPSSSSSSSSSSSEAEEKSADRHKRRKRKKLRRRHEKNQLNITVSTATTSSDTEVNVTSDTDDEKPLIDVLKKKWKSRSERDKRKKSRSEQSPFKSKDYQNHSSDRSNGESRAQLEPTSSRGHEASTSRVSIDELCDRTIGEFSRTNWESSRSNGESSRTNGESSRTTAESSRTTGESSRTTGESSRHSESRKERKSKKQPGKSHKHTFNVTSERGYEYGYFNGRNQEEPNRSNAGWRDISNGEFSYLRDDPASCSRAGESSCDLNFFPGVYRGILDPVPMDLSLPAPVAVPGCSRSRSPDCTTPPLPPQYTRTNSDNFHFPNLTPPVRVSPLRSPESGSTTEEINSSSSIKTELKQEDDSQSGYKPLVLKREKNNKWYVWADSDDSD